MVYKRTAIRKKATVRRRVQRKRTVIDNPNKTLVIRSKNHQILNDKVEVWLSGQVGYYAATNALTNASGHQYFDLVVNQAYPFTSALNGGSSETGSVILTTLFPTRNTYSDAIATAQTIGFNTYMNSGGEPNNTLYGRGWVLKTHVTIQLQSQSLGDAYYMMMLPFASAGDGAKTQLAVNPFENAENPFCTKLIVANGYMDNKCTTLRCSVDWLKLLGKSKTQYLGQTSSGGFSFGSNTSAVTGQNPLYVRCYIWSTDNASNAQPISIQVKIRNLYHFEEPANQYAN